jgi:hypothetical protein
MNTANSDSTHLVYYISDRPEAYEIGGEVGRDEARDFARVIAEHAARHFPRIEFCIDSDWHAHDEVMDEVAAYIESHWQSWVARAHRQMIAG